MDEQVRAAGAQNPDEPKGNAFSRWSRRKSQVTDEMPAETTADMATESGVDGPSDLSTDIDQPTDEPAEEPLLCDEDMPAIESLDSGSDMSCFFNRGVSEKLRQAALHHLLRLPAFNIRDGLNDYDEDYTVFEPLGDTITCDMRFHTERKARLAAEEEAARLAELEHETADTDPVESAEAEAADSVEGEEHEPEINEPEVGESEVNELEITDSETNESGPVAQVEHTTASFDGPTDGTVPDQAEIQVSLDSAEQIDPDSRNTPDHT